MTLVPKGLLLLALMLATAVFAVVMHPTRKIADQRNQLVLEAAIPREFGDWKLDTLSAIALVSPDVQAQLDKIYNQTLTRTYANSRGQKIMVSIAYGGDQSDSLAVHMPEGCYRGQGFQVKPVPTQNIEIRGSHIPLVRMVAEKGPRTEPVSYWIFIGSDFATTRTERKIAQLKSSLYGTIPEGVLVRVSSIGKQIEAEYAIQEQFIELMVSSMSSEDRNRIVGGEPGTK